ncbi:MAG: formylglycine-generating enzyme family protein [Phycisphaerae bacterium]|nr:formylglycine-generating enzyme family protein [Phycisphaerae bacterium]
MKQVTVFRVFCLLPILIAQNGCTKKEPPSAGNETTNEISSESHQPEQGKVITNSIGMKLVYIPAGSFMMGSPSTEEGRFPSEGPQHEVGISKVFLLSQTEVTQGQYESVMDAQPWSGRKNVQESANNPAANVSWDDAVEFCRKLSQQTGEKYRLPTEAEWEYACRAGTDTAYSFGDDEKDLAKYAWFRGNSDNQTQPVGQKAPNKWGLYDVHGNVCEWCSDWHAADYYSKSPESNPQGPDEGSYRVLRGGGWDNPPQSCRSAYRHWGTPSYRSYGLGFRVARSFVSK